MGTELARPFRAGLYGPHACSRDAAIDSGELLGRHKASSKRDLEPDKVNRVMLWAWRRVAIFGASLAILLNTLESRHLWSGREAHTLEHLNFANR